MKTQPKQGNKKSPAQGGAPKKNGAVSLAIAPKPAAPGNGAASPTNGAASTANGTTARQATQVSAKAQQAEQLAATKQARHEADLAARQERRAAAQAAQARRRTMRMLLAGGIALLVVAAIVVGSFWYSDAHPGEQIADQGNQHIAIGAEHPAYNSDPPTSGWHASDLAGWGVFSTMPAIERLIHNMEDGGVNVYYRADTDAATLDKLKALVGSYSDKVALSPYDKLSDPIVLTAWTRLERFQSFDDAGLRKFINAYRGIDHHVGTTG